jgi:hypothetical protein
VQVQHDARSRRPRRRQRAPPEGRVDVVRADRACARAAHRGGHVVGVQAAAQQRHRRARAPERRAVAFEQLRLLAQVLAHQPQEVLDRALLAAGDPVAVVQEEDHGCGQS